MIEPCQHIGHRVYTKRIFQNLTTHYCVQCLNCGQVVKQNNKLWLKLDDIPPNVTIRPFDEFIFEGNGHVSN